jgi:putative ABC transport system permease protein
MKERSNLHGRIWRASAEEEVTEEFAFHVAMRTRELMAQGVSEEEARRLAVARFGDIGSVQAECTGLAAGRDRKMRRTLYWSEWWQDVRFALRQLRRTPGLSLLMIGILAVGAGATTTIFSVLNAVVLRPLAFEHEQRVYYLAETWRDQSGDFSAASYLDARSRLRTFQHIAAIDWSNAVLDAGVLPDRVLAAAVSRDYFEVYGVRPVRGRSFTEADEAVGAPPVAILSAEAFQTRFGSDPSVVGRDVRVNGELVRIIGVLPDGFDPLLYGEELYLPLRITAEEAGSWGSRYLNVVALARPGTSRQALQADLARVTALQRQQQPVEQAERALAADRLRDMIVGDYDRRLALLLGSVLLVLLIACANVANLLLARGGARQKEIAVRGALGAGRGRILRQLLTENLVLALATLVVALLVAALGVPLIVALAPADIPRVAEARVDGTVLLFALLVSMASSLIFGLAPALRTLSADLQATLRSGGRDTRAVMHDWMRNGLVGSEVALCVLLVTGAGLFIRTSINIAAVDPGFRTRGILTARVTLPAETYSDPQQARSAFVRISEALAAQPGVELAAVASLPPLGPGGNEMFLEPEGGAPSREQIVGRMRIVSPGYLQVMAIPLLRGRSFDARDHASGARAAIVSTELADDLWPGQDPLGKSFICCDGDGVTPTPWTVVGVTASVRSQGPVAAPYPELYVPLAQTPPAAWPWFGRTMTLVAAGEAGESPSPATIREAVQRVDPSLPVFALSTLDEVLAAINAASRFNTILLSLLGVVGLLLAASGIYGVVSYFVSLRTREIGIRIALGASRASVVRLMVGRTLLPVAIGLVAGTAGALAGASLLRASLFGVSAADPLTLGSALLGVCLVATVATLLPARRAAGIPPTQALIE